MTDVRRQLAWNRLFSQGLEAVERLLEAKDAELADLRARLEGTDYLDTLDRAEAIATAKRWRDRSSENWDRACALQALAPYVQHKPECQISEYDRTKIGDNWNCTCGLRDLGYGIQ